MDVFFNFSPHIVAGAISYTIYSETVFIVDKDGKQDSYMEPNMTIYPSFTLSLIHIFRPGGTENLQ